MLRNLVYGSGTNHIRGILIKTLVKVYVFNFIHFFFLVYVEVNNLEVDNFYQQTLKFNELLFMAFLFFSFFPGKLHGKVVVNFIQFFGLLVYVESHFLGFLVFFGLKCIEHPLRLSSLPNLYFILWCLKLWIRYFEIWVGLDIGPSVQKNARQGQSHVLARLGCSPI